MSWGGGRGAKGSENEMPSTADNHRGVRAQQTCTKCSLRYSIKGNDKGKLHFTRRYVKVTSFLPDLNKAPMRYLSSSYSQSRWVKPRWPEQVSMSRLMNSSDGVRGWSVLNMWEQGNKPTGFSYSKGSPLYAAKPSPLPPPLYSTVVSSTSSPLFFTLHYTHCAHFVDQAVRCLLMTLVLCSQQKPLQVTLRRPCDSQDDSHVIL